MVSPNSASVNSYSLWSSLKQLALFVIDYIILVDGSAGEILSLSLATADIYWGDVDDFIG